MVHSLFSYSGPNKGTHYYTLIAILFGWFMMGYGALSIPVAIWQIDSPPYANAADIQFSDLTSEDTKRYVEELKNTLLARATEEDLNSNRDYYFTLLNGEHKRFYTRILFTAGFYFILGLLLWIVHRNLRKNNL